MSTPPDRSSLAAYAAAAHTNANKAQAGAVAVAGAIGKNIARGAASWLNSAVSTVSDHLPAARSATQYYSYDAQRASQGAYKRAKRTIHNFAGGAAALSSWMGLDLTDREVEQQFFSNSSKDGGGGDKGDKQQHPDSPISAEAGAVELLPGYFVPGESECHYTPKPTGLGGQVDVSRVQVQLAPVFVASPELYRHQASATGGAASASFSMSGENNSNNATLCLSLVGPGGAPGFAIFRIDCSDVYEEVVELHLMELEALGAVKSVCVAEVVSPAPASRTAAAGGGAKQGQQGQQQQAVVHQKLAVILTEKCILQYNIAQRKVIAFQSLAFEAADLKLSAYFAIVVHSGFGQLSILSLYGKDSNKSKGRNDDDDGMRIGGSSTSLSSLGGGGGRSNNTSNNNNSFAFALDEIEVIVPESDEIAICDRWLAYVGSGSDAARTSTRLLSYAERTRGENISKNIHKGLATVGGFLGAAVSKAMQVSGVSSSSSSSSAGAASGSSPSGGGGAPGVGADDYDDGLVFNPRALGAQPIDSSDKSIGTVVIRDLHSRCDIAAFVAHDNPIQKMAFDETGTMLATCANDGKHIHVFRICPRGTATRSTTVAAVAALSRMPRLPSVGSIAGSMGGGSQQSLFGLAAAATAGSGGYASGDNLSGMASPSGDVGTQHGTMFPAASGSTTTISNSINSSSSSAPCTTVIFTHRISRGMTGSTITSLSFSQPWAWLAATTTVGTAHFFRLNLDRLCNVEENIVAGESGLQPAVNVAGAAFRIRSAPATTPPNPVVCFFPGEAATGAGEQTTACIVTKTSTVATAVVSSACDKGVVLFERGASQFSGQKRDNQAVVVGPAAAAQKAQQQKAQQQQKYMTAEAAWMELLHRRTQPAFAPLHGGIKVQPLPTPTEDEEEEE